MIDDIEVKKNLNLNRIPSSIIYRLDDGVVVVTVIVFVDVDLVFVWFCCFFGLAGGVFFGDLFDRIDRLDPRLVNLLIAPVFCGGGGAGLGLPEKLFCLGGEQPK